MERDPREKGIWKFGKFELDEREGVLRGTDKPLSPGTKPWLVLLALLNAGGRRVSKEDLMAAVWPGKARADDTLKGVIADLREALDDDKQIVASTPGGGYKMGISFEFMAVTEPQKFSVTEGMALPGKEGWFVGAALGQGKTSWVWMAGKNGRDLRVVRFAEGQLRQRAIHREFEVSNEIAARAPASSCFVRVLGEHRDQQCHYIEMELAGQGLRAWTAAQQREQGLSRELALNIMTQVCDAVATLHGLGLVHNDLRPANILVAPGSAPNEWHVRLTGLGNVVDLNADLSAESNSKQRLPNSVYRAPESPSGSPATLSTDVYALGILLFQLLRGDFSISPTGAWQKLIQGEVSKSDVEMAVAQDPRSRLHDASELAERLHSVESRQLKHDLRATRRKLTIVSSTAIISLALALTILFFVWRARVEEQNAATINAFVTEDLLRESNPAYGEGINETLHEAINRIRPRIEARFADRPRIAAQVHEEIAEALANEVDVDGAGSEFDAAAKDWILVRDSDDAVYAELQHALLDLKSQKAGSLDAAKQLLSQEAPALAKLGHPSSRVTFARLDDEGMIALLSGDLQTAKQKFQTALDAAGADSHISNEVRLSEQARLCYIQAHVGEADTAASCFERLVPLYKSMYGDLSGPVLNLQVNLAQALMLDKQFGAALKEADDIYPRLVNELGPTNQVTQTVLGVRAQSEAGLSRWNDAIRDTLAIAETAGKTDPTGFLAVMGYSDAAKLECGENRLKEGEGHAREALLAASSPNQSRGLLGEAQYSVAYCILAAPTEGATSDLRLLEAGRLLDSIDVPSAAAIAGEPGWGANVDLARAQLAFARKQYCVAAKYLSLAKPSFMPPGSDQAQRKVVEILALKLQHTAC